MMKSSVFFPAYESECLVSLEPLKIFWGETCWKPNWLMVWGFRISRYWFPNGSIMGAINSIRDPPGWFGRKPWKVSGEEVAEVDPHGP